MTVVWITMGMENDIDALGSRGQNDWSKEKSVAQ